MAQWGNTDDAANSVLWATAAVNLAANTTNQTSLFGNTTLSGLISGISRGQFGMDTTETSVSNTSVAAFTVVTGGSGYSANAIVTVTGNATANATASATGRISLVNVTAVGHSYASAPTVTVAAPSAQTFNANSAVTNATDAIAITTANSIFLAGDIVLYTVAAGNTALTNLVTGTNYFIKASNTTAITLSETLNGDAIDLTKGLTQTGHSFTGQTATASAVLTSGARTGAHAGWVLRTVGSGGRAGRVQYETLVAMGSLTGDAEDVVLKDS